MFPATNFSPPFNVTRASHLVLTSRDLAKARDFYTEVVGLKVAEESATTIHFRAVEEHSHHCLTLRRTKGEPECERLGFRMFDEEELEKAKVWFESAGLPAKFVNVPFQGRTLHAADRDGTPLEFCARMKVVPRTHAQVNEHKGAAALRMDHFQVLVPNVTASASFYAALGFRGSSYFYAGERLVGAFLFRKDNPHDLVFLSRSGPRFHHVGYIVTGMENVLRALDCAGALGFADALEHGPGRHGFGHPNYAYLRDPDGHRLELLPAPIQIIDIDDDPARYDLKGGNANHWGAPPPRSWFEEASAFSGVPIVEAAAGDPLTLERYLAAKVPAVPGHPAEPRSPRRRGRIA
jgi:catechol 2,3-dioxygenase